MAQACNSNATTTYIIFDPARSLQVTFVTIIDKRRLNSSIFFFSPIASLKLTAVFMRTFTQDAPGLLDTKMDSRSATCIIEAQ